MNRKIDIDRGLFPLAFSVVRCVWLPLSAAALLLVASRVGEGYVHAPLAFAVLRAAILMIAGYSAYRVLLTGGSVKGWQAVGTHEGYVPWRYAGVMLMVLTPILLLGIVWTAPGTGAGPNSLNDIALGVVLVVAYAVLYVLLGTALPEIAERGDAALGDALERGRTNYRRIAVAMVTGAWLFRAASIAVLITASIMGVTVDLFSGQTGAFQPAALVPMLLFTGSHVFAEVLTAVVLVRAYRRFPVSAPDAVAA